MIYLRASERWWVTFNDRSIVLHCFRESVVATKSSWSLIADRPVFVVYESKHSSLHIILSFNLAYNIII
jgi:hypothetical protein